MEKWTGEGFECARRCLEARAGKDDETSLALTRAAGMYALKALGLLQEPFGDGLGQTARYAGDLPLTRP